jgi:hypothetical protein
LVPLVCLEILAHLVILEPAGLLDRMATQARGGRLDSREVAGREALLDHVVFLGREDSMVCLVYLVRLETVVLQASLVLVALQGQGAQRESQVQQGLQGLVEDEEEMDTLDSRGVTETQVTQAEMEHQDNQACREREEQLVYRDCRGQVAVQDHLDLPETEVVVAQGENREFQAHLEEEEQREILEIQAHQDLKETRVLPGVLDYQADLDFPEDLEHLGHQEITVYQVVKVLLVIPARQVGEETRGRRERRENWVFQEARETVV